MCAGCKQRRELTDVPSVGMYLAYISLNVFLDTATLNSDYSNQCHVLINSIAFK